MSTYAEIQLQLERERFLARLNQAKEKSSTSTKPTSFRAATASTCTSTPSVSIPLKTSINSTSNNNTTTYPYTPTSGVTHLLATSESTQSTRGLISTSHTSTLEIYTGPYQPITSMSQNDSYLFNILEWIKSQNFNEKSTTALIANTTSSPSTVPLATLISSKPNSHKSLNTIDVFLSNILDLISFHGLKPQATTQPPPRSSFKSSSRATFSSRTASLATTTQEQVIKAAYQPMPLMSQWVAAACGGLLVLVLLGVIYFVGKQFRRNKNVVVNVLPAERPNFLSSIKEEPRLRMKKSSSTPDGFKSRNPLVLKNEPYPITDV